MKRSLLFLSIVFLVACKKNNDVDSLVGKWRLTEIYNGYAMGGCFCWIQVGPDVADHLEFSSLGRYKLTKSLLSSSTGCSGRYRVVNDTTIVLTYDCQADPDKEYNRKFTKTIYELTIDYQTIEGVIRYRYVRI